MLDEIEEGRRRIGAGNNVSGRAVL